MSVFVDTGVLFAAAMKRDAGHSRAARLLKTLSRQDPISTDHVLVETWALLVSRTTWDGAMKFWQALPTTPLIVEAVTLVDLERARAIAWEWRTQRFDLVDCTSFAVMERLGCTRAATFDRDFAIYRFGPERRRAFEILAGT